VCSGSRPHPALILDSINFHDIGLTQSNIIVIWGCPQTVPGPEGEIINLRRARKERARAAAAKEAAANRNKHGRTRAEREAAGQMRALEEKRLEAHKREMAPSEDQAE
jgi:Domain of unknown function (DUF4169)